MRHYLAKDQKKNIGGPTRVTLCLTVEIITGKLIDLLVP